jgi:hypothetical protein
VWEPLLQAFPFPSTLGKVTLHLHCQACVFLYSSCERWVFPALLWSFPFTATFTSFPAPDYWAVLLLLLAAMFVYSSNGNWVFPPVLWSFPPSALSEAFLLPPEPLPACLVCLFTVLGRIPFPQSLALSEHHPLSHVSLLFLLLISQFLFFPPGGGRPVQGAMLLWPRLVCGSTTVPQSSPGSLLPKQSGCWRLAARGPFWFLHLT